MMSVTCSGQVSYFDIFQMSLVVEQQDEVINVIETQAAGVEKDTEVGYVIHIISWLCDI